MRLHLPLLLLLASPLPAQERRDSVPQPLDTVRVSSRAGGPLASPLRAVEVIGRDALAQTGGATVGEVIANRLGVDLYTRSPAQADLQLRGASFNQVLVLVDGVRVSDVQSGHFALDLAVPLESVERIEILRGTGSTLYGSDAVGGVVNVVTRAAGDQGSADLRAAGGSFGAAHAALSLAGALPAGSRPLRARVSADHARSDGHRAGTDYRMTQGVLALARTGRGGTLALDLGLGARDFGAADFYAPFPSFERTRSSTAALRWTPAAAARPGAWRVSALGHTRRHADVFTLRRDDPAFYQNRHLSWQSGGEVVAHTTTPSFRAALGAEAFGAQLASARLGSRREQRGALFAEASAGQRQRAGLGARIDWSDEHGAFFSPSLAVVAPVIPRLELRGAIDRGFRAPTWTERYYADPANRADSTVGPERFWAAELGARALPRWGRLDVTAWARRAQGLIDWARPAGAPAGTPWRTMNVTRAVYRGIEAEAALAPMLGIAWSVSASGLRFDAAGAEGWAGKYALRPLTRTLAARAEAALPLGASATLDVRQLQRAREHSHVWAGARIARRWREIRVTLDLTNLAAADYLDASGKPIAGRGALAGVEWRAGRQ